MSDIRTEERLSTAQAAEAVQVNIKTIQRWWKPTDAKGRLKRKFLESYLRGGRRYWARA